MKLILDSTFSKINYSSELFETAEYDTCVFDSCTFIFDSIQSYSTSSILATNHPDFAC
mgnify:CR=1 FL=1